MTLTFLLATFEEAPSESCTLRTTVGLAGALTNLHWKLPPPMVGMPTSFAPLPQLG